MRKVKLWHETIYPNGAWRVIANESEHGIVDDDEIYYYVEDDIDLGSIVPGQEILLDEKFVVKDVIKDQTMEIKKE